MTDIHNMSVFALPAAVLLLAFLLDLAIGDPGWLPHPVRTIGSATSGLEDILRRHFRTPWQERLGGALLVAAITGLTFALSCIAVYFLLGLHRSLLTYCLSLFFLVYLTSTTIAVRELVGSARLVILAVKKGGTEEARKRLGMIVGRDTHNLSDREILKATMETLAENLSDGIIAPVFYLVIGGLPLALTYKAINTLDSMVGYKNAKYRDFGRAAAKLDDIANYVPARITGGLIAAAVFSVLLFKCPRSAFRTALDSLSTMMRDGRKHSSPNSGVPEAAMAGALGVRMGGASRYGGVIVEKPYIGEDRTDDYLTASMSTIDIVMTASMIGIGMAALVLFMRSHT